MSRFHERSTGLITPNILTSAVATIDLNDAGSGDTFTLTLTQVGTATASTTGTITWNATPATLAGNIQTAIRAVTGYATSAVAEDTDPVYTVTLDGTLSGYDVDITITGATGFTPGSVTQVTEGSSAITDTISVGRFAVPKRLRLEGWIDNSLDVAILDADSRTVFSKTAIDTNNAGADSPYDVYLTADGLAGEDGAAAASVGGGIFAGPFTVTVTGSGGTNGNVALFADLGNPSGSAFKLRSTGTFTGASTTVNLGATVAKIKALRLTSSADTSVAPTITDAEGKNIYTKTSTDYTTAVFGQLSHEGVDQAGNAVADTLDVIAKSPVTVAQTGLGSGTFKVEFWVEV